MKLCLPIFCLSFLLLSGLSGAKTFAATITVNGLNDVVANNGVCTLREAVTNANANNQTGSTDCTAGQPTATAVDVINISAVGTISLTTATLISITESLTINGNNQTISRNDAGNRVFSITAGTVTINNLTMRDGLTTGAALANGGGCLAIGAATVNINNSVITSCSTSNFGGAIINDGGTVTLTNSTVSASTQTAATGNGGGGAIYNNAGTMNIIDSTVSGNTAVIFGGGILHVAGTMNITRSTVSGNSAAALNTGGGIDNSSTLNLVNSTVSGNTASNTGGTNGGGYINFSGAATITNSTITNNTAAGANGGAGARRDGGTVTVRNTIIAGNNVSNSNVFGAFVSQGFNLVQTTTGSTGFNAATDITGVSANLGPLNNNSGPTQTHALQTGSPAIDKGSLAAGITTDQRGGVRPIDNAAIPNAAGGNGSDIGAFEVQAPTAAVISIGGRVVTPQDLGLTNALVTLTDSQGVSQTILTGKFGSFIFREVAAGETYVISVSSKRYYYESQVVTPTENITSIIFNGQ